MVVLDTKAAELSRSYQVEAEKVQASSEIKATQNNEGKLYRNNTDAVSLRISSRARNLGAVNDIQKMRQKISRLSIRENDVDADVNAKNAIEKEISRLKVEINRISVGSAENGRAARTNTFYEPGLAGGTFDNVEPAKASEMISKSVDSILSNATEAFNSQATFTAEGITRLLA